MPDTDITPIEGFAAGMNQRALDDQKIQRAPLETELLRAHAGKATLDLQNQQTMMRKMSEAGRGQAGQMDSQSGTADWLGRLFLESGQPEKGLKAFDAASLMRSRAATADLSSARAVIDRGRAVIQKLDLYDRAINQATDQSSFDLINAQHLARTGELGMLAGQVFSPKLLQDFSRETMGAKSRLDLALKDQEAQSRDRLRTRREEEYDALDRYRDWKKSFAEKQLAWKEKHGGSGKGVTSPTKAEQSEVTRLIKRDYPELFKRNEEEAQTAAFTIASRARELRQQNPALGTDAALSRAYAEEIKAGSFKRSEAVKNMIGYTTKDAETKFLPGNTAATAAPLPKGNDSSQLVPGHFYTDSGITMKWDPQDPEAEDGWVEADEDEED